MQDIGQQQPSLGINRDYSPEFQQDGTYTFALNAMKSIENIEALQNEMSNRKCVDLPYKLIGAIFINDVFVVFLTDNINSEIGIFNPEQCSYTKLDVACNLNLSQSNLVRGVSKVLNYCNERIIYWTDGINPYRYLNIDRLDDVLNCNYLDLFTCNQDEVVGEASLISGGGFLLTGVYQVILRYNNQSVVSAPIFISNIVPVIDESIGEAWQHIDGAPALTTTNKSIELVITEGLNPANKAVDIILASYLNGKLEFRIIDTVEIVEDSLKYIVSINNGTTVDQVTLSSSSYRVGEIITEHNGRLLLGNIKKANNINYQALANNIKIKWASVKIPLEETYKTDFRFKSFMRDEVYAFAIVWKFCDGTYSPAYHIPGPKMSGLQHDVIQSKLLISEGITGFEAENTYEDITYSNLSDIVPANDINNYFGCPTPAWKVFNMAATTDYPHEEMTTEDLCNINYATNIKIWESGEMSYHQYDERYPTIQDCDGEYIYPHTINTCENDYSISIQTSINIDGDLVITPTILPYNYNTELEINYYNGSDLYATTQAETTISIPQYIFNNPVTVEISLTGLDNNLYTQSFTVDYTSTIITVQMLCEVGLVIMDKVRHHRMPSIGLTPHFENSGTFVENKWCNTNVGGSDILIDVNPSNTPSWGNKKIYPLSIVVENIQLPQDSEVEVVGYEIVYVKRTDLNSTIIAKGVLHNTAIAAISEGLQLGVIPLWVVNGMPNNNYQIQPDSDQNPYYIFKNSFGTGAALSNLAYWKSKQYKFMSPDTSFKKPSILSNHMVAEAVFKGDGVLYRPLSWTPGPGNSTPNACFSHNVSITDLVFRKYNINFPVVRASYMDAHTLLEGFEYKFVNMFQESGVALQLSRRALWNLSYAEDESYNCWDGLLPYTGISSNNNRQPQELFTDKSLAIWWTPTTNSECIQVNCATAYYASLKRDVKYNSVNTLVYNRIGSYNNGVNIFGDSFICYWAYRRTHLLYLESDDPYYGYVPGEWDVEPPNSLLFPGIPDNTLIHTIVESNIDVNLRHEGEQPNGETYYPKLFNGSYPLARSIHGYLSDFRLTKIPDPDNEDDTILAFVNEGIDNYNAYNEDYSYTDIINAFPTISSQRDLCDCDNSLRNTFVVSEEDSNEFDGWRVFKPLNYIEIPRSSGELKNLFSMGNNLFAHTTNNIWRLLTSQTQLQTNSSNVYIGTGDLFSSTPQYIYLVTEGFAGSQQFNGYLLNTTGYHFIDAYAGRVFNFTEEGMKTLEKGLMKWLIEHSKFELVQQVPGYNNIDNTILGIGWHYGYDHVYNRVMITKIDYKFKDESLFGGTLSETDCVVGNIYLHQDGRFVVIADTDCSYSFIELTNEEYFCNVSWTLSYSTLLSMFVSWHSYIPYRYIQTRNKLFSVVDTSIYQHNIPNTYQTFYEEYKPFIIEFPTKSKTTQWTDSMEYYQDAYVYDPNYKKELSRNITFTHGVIYNTTQNSGLFEFVYKDDSQEDSMYLSIKEELNKVRVTRIEKSWFYNEFVDNVIDNTIPHTTSECIDPIDEQPNIVAIDATKPYYNRMYFRDSYITQRLILDSVQYNNVRFVVKVFASTITKSLR